MAVSSSTGIFIISLLAIPVSYGVNLAQTFHGELGLFVAGVSALSIICFLTYLLVGKKGQSTDPLFYVFTMGTFASVIDLIISLECDGIVEGFMTNYLKGGEPYLKTAYGTMLCYWDGIGHYALYLMMLAALAWNQSFREVGLYWAGSIGHSMIVFIPGNVVGKFGIRPSFLLNVPYIFIPFLSAARFLKERPEETQLIKEAEKKYKSIFRRPIDLFFILGLTASMAIAFFRGFAVLGANNEAMQLYVEKYEHYLTDDTTYPKMQMLVYMFYFVPYYCMAIYGLLYPGQDWMPDWSLLHAGAAAQAQFTHIGGAFHYRTPYILRVSRDPVIQTIFLAVNVSLLVLPQLLAYRCVSFPGFFTRQAVDEKEKKS